MTQSRSETRATDSNAEATPTLYSSSRLAFWIGVTICGLYFLSCLIISRTRGLWYDEIFTLQFAKLSSLGAIWNAMLGAIDTMTPFSHWLAYFGYHYVQASPSGLRFPSAVAVTLGIFIVYDCARRFTGNFAALLSIAFLLCSFLPFYGSEARGYSFYYLFACCALWCWLCLKPNSPKAAIGIGLSFFFGVLSHYYFVLCVTPFIAYEVMTWRRGKKPSLNVISIAVGCALALLVLWPQAQAVRTFAHNFWAIASFSITQTSYGEFVPLLGFYLAIPVLLLAFFSRFSSGFRSSAPIAPMQDYERLGWLFILIPLAGYVLAKAVTHAYLNRYVLGILPGVAFAFACMAGRVFATRPKVIATFLLFLFAFSGWSQLHYVRSPNLIDPAGWYASTHDTISMEPMFERDGKHYFLHNHLIQYLEAHYYSKRPNAQSVFFDLDQSPESDPNRVAVQHLGRIAPLQFWSMKDVRGHASELVLLSPAPSLVTQLQSEGYRIVVRATTPRVAYYVEKP